MRILWNIFMFLSFIIVVATLSSEADSRYQVFSWVLAVTWVILLGIGRLAKRAHKEGKVESELARVKSESDTRDGYAIAE